MDNGIYFEWTQGYRETEDGKWEKCRNATPFISGDGNIYTTINDLIKWEEAMHNNTILTKEEYVKSISPGIFDNGDIVDYGFGWCPIVSDDGDLLGSSHSGSWDGTSTYVSRFLDKYSVYILSNIESFDTEDIGVKIEDLIVYEEDNENEDS
jgi:hypothetical protein